jgi:hypothetical protein
MQDLRRCAAEHGVSLDTAVAAGMTGKSAEFLAAGGGRVPAAADTYLGGLPAGIRRMTRQIVGGTFGLCRPTDGGRAIN